MRVGFVRDPLRLLLLALLRSDALGLLGLFHLPLLRNFFLPLLRREAVRLGLPLRSFLRQLLLSQPLSFNIARETLGLGLADLLGLRLLGSTLLLRLAGELIGLGARRLALGIEAVKLGSFTLIGFTTCRGLGLRAREHVGFIGRALL